jgi:hypothetical protein
MKLAVSHNIFLSREQRYQIATWPYAEVTVVGVSIPVWYKTKVSGKKIKLATSEPAEEIICNYLISNLRADRIVEVLYDGYRIFLPQGVPDTLRDVQDQGAAAVTFRHYTTVTLNDEEYKVGHYVSIRDDSELLETLAF